MSLKPATATAVGAAIFMAVAMAASALLWHSYEDVGRTLPLFLLICGLGAAIATLNLRRLAVPPLQGALLAAFLPVLGALWAFLAGMALFESQLTRWIPIEPRTLGGVLVQWLPLWIGIAMLTVLVRRQPRAAPSL